MLHDLFTIAVNGKRQGGRILLLPTVWERMKYPERGKTLWVSI